MDFYTFTSGKLPENAYILVNNGEAVVIDGGIHANLTFDMAEKYGFTVKYMLLTHTHFDHSTCAYDMQGKGVKVGVFYNEADGLYDHNVSLTSKVPSLFKETHADFTFTDGEELNLCGIKINVLATPGHSKGSCCFIVNDMIFTGDTLFNGSVGRTDFYGGSAEEMKASLVKLFSIGKDYKVYPGHGETSSLFYERDNNPFSPFCKK